jgi:predicted transcriptional regulator
MQISVSTTFTTYRALLQLKHKNRCKLKQVNYVIMLKTSMDAVNPIDLAARIVAASIPNKPLPKGEAPALIHGVHTAVMRIAAGPERTQPQPETKVPAVSIRRSITPGILICLDDGRRFKPLRRRLTLLGLTPEQYREKWKRLRRSNLCYGTN